MAINSRTQGHNQQKAKRAMSHELHRRLDVIVDDISTDPLATTDDLLRLSDYMSHWQKNIKSLLTLRSYE